MLALNIVSKLLCFEGVKKQFLSEQTRIVLKPVLVVRGDGEKIKLVVTFKGIRMPKDHKAPRGTSEESMDR